MTMIMMKLITDVVGIILLLSLITNSCCLITLQKPVVLAAEPVKVKVKVKVGVVLEDKESVEGKMELSCIKMALSDFYAAHPHSKTSIVLHVRDSKHHVVTAAAAVLDLLKNVKVAAILGPKTSPEAQFVINLGERAQVPIVSYTATSPFLSPLQNPYFVRATQDDSSQVQPLTSLIQAFGWRAVVPIYVDDEFGGGLVPYLADALQQIGAHIPYTSVISPSVTDDQIVAELYKLMSNQTRVFVVQTTASLASRLFLKAHQLGMMSRDYVWIVTNEMASVFNTIHPRVIRSMEGVLGVKTYLPTTKEMEDFAIRWKMKFQQENPTIINAQLKVHGVRAYDATTALAIAVEEVGVTNETFSFRRAENPADFSTDLSTFGVSRVGQRLVQAILSAKFMGLGGEFILVNGQLRSSTFQFTNVVGNGEKGIGYWTPSGGLVKELATTKYSTSKDNLGAIIWPGDQTTAPKGWVVSPHGKKLRIGVPFKDGFLEFVKVTPNLATNKTEVTGYCIDVFDAVMAKLPYSVLYEYVPFRNPGDSYDELIYQVYLKNYDAVVGDITIIAKRSSYVDFTLPYTESRVVMIAPMKDNIKKRAWLFVKPLTLDLWVTTFCFFILIAFVIWVLEHRINEDFRGPPGHQAGTCLYYAFATMVFSHSFRVFSNLTRFVMIIWVFVVLILTQSYTANLASWLTVEQLRPTIPDVKELIKRGESVGYQEGSFVKDLLIQKNFSPKQLKSFSSLEQLHDLLTRGSANGGVAVAFDEIPYMNLFLDKYCSKFTTVPLTYKTDGFGFAFPIGSPLVSEVSRKVLNVTEGEEMTGIENKWFKHQKNCPDSSTNTTSSSSSLSMDSFWGLFTIAGGASVFALVISLAGFVREHKSVWSDSSASVCTRMKTLLRIYDQKNLNSHTFSKSQPRDPSVVSV